MKKALDLKDCDAFVEVKEDFMKKKKEGKNTSGDQWINTNSSFRVGMSLTGRKKKPVYFYTESLHDAKIL